MHRPETRSSRSTEKMATTAAAEVLFSRERRTGAQAVDAELQVDREDGDHRGGRGLI